MSQAKLKKFLFAWIGDRDISASQKGEDAAISKSVKQMAITVVHLLDDRNQKSTYKPDDVKTYVQWLKSETGADVQSHQFDINPTVHKDVFDAADETIKKVTAGGNWSWEDTYFLLTSGTPANHAIWLLLAKGRYGASLIDVQREGGCRIIDLPYDIDIEIRDRIITNNQQVKKLDSNFVGIFHKSKRMADAIEVAQKFAKSSSPIVMHGQSGTGKELFAKAIHMSSRRTGKFIPFNCAAVPDTLAESELFGHEKGAFTGADKKHDGIFALAENGTVFLDEIAELSLGIQAKLLRILQDKVVFSLGGSKADGKEIDFRVIAASHKNLLKEVELGRFRNDLYQRISVLPLSIPSLAERGEECVRAVVDGIAKEKYKSWKFSKAAMLKLARERWANGNVRQLENTMELAKTLCESETIDESDINSALRHMGYGAVEHDDLELSTDFGDSGNVDLPRLVAQIEAKHIKSALSKYGTKTAAAEALGLGSYQNLDSAIRRLQKMNLWS